MSGNKNVINKINELVKQGLSKEEAALQVVLEEKQLNKPEQIANAPLGSNSKDMMQNLNFGVDPTLNNGMNVTHSQHFQHMMLNKTNPKAILSLIVAIASIVLLPIIGQIISIMLGVLALRQIRFTRERGSGLAIAGITVSVIALIITVIIAIIVAIYFWYYWY